MSASWLTTNTVSHCIGSIPRQHPADSPNPLAKGNRASKRERVASENYFETVRASLAGASGTTAREVQA